MREEIEAQRKLVELTRHLPGPIHELAKQRLAELLRRQEAA